MKDPLQQAAVVTIGLSEAEVGADFAQLATDSIMSLSEAEVVKDSLKQAAAAGKGSSRPPPAARARVYKGDSEDLGMAAQDTTTLLKDFTACGCGGVGSTVAHRRARQRGQAKAAAVPFGLVGNKYAVLAEELEADERPL